MTNQPNRVTPAEVGAYGDAVTEIANLRNMLARVTQQAARLRADVEAVEAVARRNADERDEARGLYAEARRDAERALSLPSAADAWDEGRDSMLAAVNPYREATV